MSVPRRLGIGGVHSPDVTGSSRTIQSSRALLQQKLNDNGMPIADPSADSSSTPSSPASRPSSPGGYNSNLYSPKPSPGVRVNVASPAPSSGSTPPASYTVLPALDRSHRYVITGTLQQSLFGVVKLAFDRQLKVQVAIKISRRERAQQQQTRSGVSVLENVRREAAVMRYMHERSASANNALHASAESSVQARHTQRLHRQRQRQEGQTLLTRTAAREGAGGAEEEVDQQRTQQGRNDGGRH